MTARATARPFPSTSSAQAMSAAVTSSTRWTARASSTACWREKRLPHERWLDLYRRHGADAHRAVARAEPRARHQADSRGRSARRRLRAHTRGEQHDATEPQGVVRASRVRGRRSLAEGLSGAGGGTEYPSPYRLAGAALFAAARRQPLVPDPA